MLNVNRFKRFLLLFLLLFTWNIQAQQKGGLSNEELYRKNKPKDKKTNPIISPNKVEVGSPKIETQKLEMKGLATALENATALEVKTKAELTKPKDNCEFEYLQHKMRDAAFVKSNAGTIQWIHNQIRDQIVEEQNILNGFRAGIVKGKDPEDFTNLEGKTYQTATLNLKNVLPDGKGMKVSVVELFKFIDKYSEEALQVEKDKGDLDALIQKYNHDANLSNQEYFGLTLSVAVRAFQNLSRPFSETKTQQQSRELVIGTGSKTFLVISSNLFTREPVSGAKISTLIQSRSKESAAELSIQKPVSAFTDPVSEQEIYDICRNLQITIQSGAGAALPIDGLLRAQEFEKSRTKECGNVYFFSAPVAGPLIDYKTEVQDCRKVGIRIVSAVAEAYNWQNKGGTLKTFVFTDQIESEAAGNFDYTMSKKLDDYVPAMFGLGSPDFDYVVTYKCGCGEQRLVNHCKGRAQWQMKLPCPQPVN